MPRIPKPWLRKGRGWYVNINRTRFFLGRDKEPAFAEYHRLMLQPQESRQVSPQHMVAVIDKFLSWVETKRAPATYEWYRDLLQKFATRYPSLRVGEIRPYHVTEWVDELPSLGKNSQRNHMRAVKRALRWAKKQGYIAENPLADLEMPSAESREVCLSEEEYRTLLDLASPDSLKDLITVTWQTGCRPQESLRVEARHVDLANQRWLFPKSEAKGKRRVRAVYLTDEALHITRRLMLKHPEGKLFRSSSGKAWTIDTVNSAISRVQVRMGRTLIKSRGIVISDKEVAAKVKTIARTKKDRGVLRDKTPAELKAEARRKLTDALAVSLAPRYSLYALRHSWATHALERGVDPVTVSVLMGHSDPSVLAKTYQHVAKNPQFMLSQAKRASVVTA